MAKINKNELIRLKKTLVTDAAIGEKIGVTRQTIHALRKKYGIKSNYADNPDRNVKIVAAYKTGVLGPVLAKKHDLSTTQIYRILYRDNALKKVLKKRK
jgi:Mor family transcriptional regulator